MRNLIFGAVLLIFAACGKSEKADPKTPEEPNPPQETTIIKNGQSIKVMAYNIRHASPPAQPTVINVPGISAVINRERPDFVALQEVDVNTRRSGTSLNQAQALAAQTGMKVFFSKSRDYDGGEYGNAILSKYNIVRSIRYELPIAPGATSNPEVRSLAVIEVAAEGGQKVYFGSTHLEVDHAETRNAQIDRIREIATNLDAPFILGGDFNAQPGSESINRLIAGNLFKSGCVNNSCPFTFPANSANRTIDFIFLNQKAQADFTVQSYATVDEKTASDHLPVLTQLKYK